ncbi:MAG: hypothetical protein HOE48_10305 [Candidatus Latescibacteria bacterium]|nr:hypothetical protein [Candidatus Latescibacterota bacterium]MBT4138300.1 hypothetical protein [Candidatus Latescibacterota bacterium]MBT5830686.1 hypothetical protein [Candidatus Latescibacterota bacterium]
MGAADALPGQTASKFEVSGDFGFCQNCGTGHGAALAGEEEKKAPEVNGTPIPDLHAVLGAEEAEEGASSSGETETEGETEAELTKETERDVLTGDVELSEEEKKQVEELKRRDQEVRTHEHAHVAAGGQHVRGGISYEYQAGPDGKRYAVGGEVSIDTSAERDPEDTIRKAQTIRQAALAPAEPSGQDRKAAAAAAQMEVKARQEIAEAKLEESQEGSGEVEGVGNSEGAEDILGETGGEENEERAPELPTGQGVSGADETDRSVSETGLPEAEGVSVSEVPEEGETGDFGVENGLDVGEKEKGDGLPEVPEPSVSSPAIKLDYGQHAHAGGLMDVYG